MRSALGLAILAFLASSTAQADPRPRKLTIEAEKVGGERPDPGGSDVRVRPFEPAGSLLRLRRDFIDAIVKAADDL